MFHKDLDHSKRRNPKFTDILTSLKAYKRLFDTTQCLAILFITTPSAFGFHHSIPIKMTHFKKSFQMFKSSHHPYFYSLHGRMLQDWCLAELEEVRHLGNKSFECDVYSPRKLTASWPLESDGTGRRSFPFEMVPFKERVSFRGTRPYPTWGKGESSTQIRAD